IFETRKLVKRGIAELGIADEPRGDGEPAPYGGEVDARRDVQLPIAIRKGLVAARAQAELQLVVTAFVRRRLVVACVVDESIFEEGDAVLLQLAKGRGHRTLARLGIARELTVGMNVDAVVGERKAGERVKAAPQVDPEPREQRGVHTT